jgi:hypothetical protein
MTTSSETGTHFAKRVQLNQRKLRSALKSHYDFIVCGFGSSGSVVARKLAETPNVSVPTPPAHFDRNKSPQVTKYLGTLGPNV